MIESIHSNEHLRVVSTLVATDTNSKKKAKKKASDVSALLLAVATTLEKNARKSADKRASKTSESQSSGDSESGLYASLDAIVLLILMIQNLQSADTELGVNLSNIVSDESIAENAALKEDADKMAADEKDAGKRAADNAKFQTDMTKFNNQIQTAQTQVQNFMSLIGDLSKSISSNAQNSQSLINTMLAVAGLLR